MWRSEKGNWNTSSFPDPDVVFTPSALSQFLHLAADAADEVKKMLDEEDENFVMGLPTEPADLAVEAEFRYVHAPPELIDVPVRTVSELRERRGEIDWRWRLDVMMAVSERLMPFR